MPPTGAWTHNQQVRAGVELGLFNKLQEEQQWRQWLTASDSVDLRQAVQQSWRQRKRSWALRPEAASELRYSTLWKNNYEYLNCKCKRLNFMQNMLRIMIMYIQVKLVIAFSSVREGRSVLLEVSSLISYLFIIWTCVSSLECWNKIKFSICVY